MLRKSRFRIAYQFLFHVCTVTYVYIIWGYFVNLVNPPVIPFIVSFYVSGMLLYFLHQRWQKNGLLLYIVLVVPLTVLLLWAFQVNPLISFLIIAFNYKRILQIYDNELFSHSSLAVSTAVGLSVVTVLVGIAHQMPNPELALYIVVAQFFIFFGGYFISIWLETTLETRDRQKILAQFSLLFPVTILAVVILTAIMPYLRIAASWLLGSILTPFFKLLEPLIEAFYNRIEYTGSTDGEETSTDFLMEGGKGIVDGLTDGGYVNILPILYTILAIAVALIVYKMLKTKPNPIEEEPIDAKYEMQRKLVENYSVKKNKNHLRPPSNIPVRKAMYEFEKKAKKFNKGRITGETVQEWFTRLNINQKEIIPIYEQVRYGEKSISTDQIEKFLQFTSDLEKRWKSEKKHK